MLLIPLYLYVSSFYRQLIEIGALSWLLLVLLVYIWNA